MKGKVAWITGGGSGIGLAGALELARAGAHVVISGRSAETLKQAQKEVKAVGSVETGVVATGAFFYGARSPLGFVDG